MACASLLYSGVTADNLNQKVTAKVVSVGRLTCQANTYIESFKGPAGVQGAMKMVGKSSPTVAFEA